MVEEQHREHHEHHEAHKKSSPLDWWKIIAVVGVVLLVVSVFTAGFRSWSFSSRDVVTQKTLSFVNQELLQGQAAAKITEVATEQGLYRMKIDLNGKELDTYVTKDGAVFFPQGIKVSEFAASSSSDVQAAPQNVPKTDKPVVDLYVMSFCPYGNKAEETMYPVYTELKDKVTWNVHYIVGVSGTTVQSKHGQPEADQNMREVCVKENYGLDAFWKFLSYVNQNCGYNGACWKDAAKAANADSAKIESCVATKGLDYMKAEAAASDAAGAQGSPTLIINGVETNSVYSYGQPNTYLKAICDSFTTAPAECAKVINSTAATAAASSAASCNT
jgi:glutaredoxin